MRVPKDKVGNKYTEQVERGKQGKNIGLALDQTQYGRLTRYIANIQQGRYDLIAAPTGCGKSSLIMDMYMVNPIRYVKAHPEKGITLKILYFNMELPVQNIVAKFVARRAFEDSKGRIRLSVNKIFQKGEMTSRELQTTIEHYKNAHEELLEYATFYEGSITWRYMYKEIRATLKELGTFTRIPNPTTSNPNGYYEHYEYHNPDTYVICIADHIGLLKASSSPEDKKTDKGILDDLVNNCVISTRNKWGVTWALAQQMNRANEDPNRMRSATGSEPLNGDLMGSSVPGQGADTVIALYKPQDFGLKKYMGYPVEDYKKFFVSAKLLKNRDGPDKVVDNFGFLGPVGYFQQLPYPEDIGKKGFPTHEQVINRFRYE